VGRCFLSKNLTFVVGLWFRFFGPSGTKGPNQTRKLHYSKNISVYIYFHVQFMRFFDRSTMRKFRATFNRSHRYDHTIT